MHMFALKVPCVEVVIEKTNQPVDIFLITRPGSAVGRTHSQQGTVVPVAEVWCAGLVTIRSRRMPGYNGQVLGAVARLGNQSGVGAVRAGNHPVGSGASQKSTVPVSDDAAR
jgi:hypothetical protein